MAVMKLDIELSTPDLLRAAAQLPPHELKLVVKELIALNARKTAVVLTESEADLLQKINQGLPASLQERLMVLQEKRQAETLTAAEIAELQAVTAQIEALNVTRMEHLIALAQLRQIPLTRLMQDLGLQASYA